MLRALHVRQGKPARDHRHRQEAGDTARTAFRKESHGLDGGVVWKVAVLDGAGGAGGTKGIGAMMETPGPLVPGRPEKNFMNICGVRFSVSGRTTSMAFVTTGLNGRGASGSERAGTGFVRPPALSGTGADGDAAGELEAPAALAGTGIVVPSGAAGRGSTVASV